MSKYIKPELLEESDFVNLHGHSKYSVGDALGSPEEIVNSVIENNMNAVAITDHGNLSVLADFYNHVNKSKINRKIPDNFKPIIGCEFYFHPDLKQWELDVEQAKLDAAQEKKNKSSKSKNQDESEDLSKEQIENLLGAKGNDDNGGMEDEKESKTYNSNPASRRHHLVLLAQNENGLRNIFKLNAFAQSKGYGGYSKQRKMPRIDFNILEENSEGIICTSACLAGDFSYILNKGLSENLSESQILTQMENEALRFDEIFNKGMDKRFYLEIQFNKVSFDGEILIQQLLNEYLVKLHRKTGIPLVAAADYHYPKKELYKTRDLIKANSQKSIFSHRSIDELDCNLFPKNARQMIEEYNSMDGGSYITQDELLTSIKNSKNIADFLIENYRIDNAPKFPTMNFDPKEQMLKWVANELKTLFKDNNFDETKKLEYIERAKKEIRTIDDKKFYPYFTTYKVITDELKKQMLLSPGRGSGAGSLINYLLGITEVDPIKYNLRFDRFLDEYRVQTVPDMLYI